MSDPKSNILGKVAAQKEAQQVQTKMNAALIKEINKTLKVMAEVTPEEWADIRESTHNIKAITEAGGIDTITQDFKQHIIDTIQENIEAQLAPIYNTIDTLIGTALGTFIAEYGIDTLINSVATYMGDNTVGTIVGGIAGAIYPGGTIGTILGATIGAAVEAGLEAWFATAIDPDTGESALGIIKGGIVPDVGGYPSFFGGPGGGSKTESGRGVEWRKRRGGMIF